MDLSNLSKTLPSTRALESVSLMDINSELTDEFKTAAKSVATLYNASDKSDPKGPKTEFAAAAKAVASLYRSSTNASVLSMHKGYLECLDDLLHMIANHEDIENWALTKRAELTNHYVQDTHADLLLPPAADEHELPLAVLLGEHKFALSPDLSSDLHFRPSFPPLSVTYKRPKRLDTRQKKHVLAPTTDQLSSDGEPELAESDAEAKKRKARGAVHDAKKKKSNPAGPGAV